ncbi:class-II fumarase/aspartase family protein [Rhodococcus jostii]|jgi:adenylosuccinate lyase/3-carboxy-cis,cis-muconate cycloisomerase|nr:adenylosuccinate lyase family protein [Rhodococcus jostii]
MGVGLDDDLLRDFFGNAEQRAIFDGPQRLQGWLDVERALAQTQAELGIIPAEAAQRISAHCQSDLFDINKLRQHVNATQHPIVPMVNALEKLVGTEFGQFVHYGATSQDIMDSGQALQLRQSLQGIERDVAAATKAAASLALKHRNTTQVGRTHGQHAVPISFGLKAATWVDELQRLQTRIAESRDRILTVQIFGAAGSMAGYGDRAFEVKAGVASRLGLTEPVAPWHATRDRIAELGSLMALLAGVSERIAAEVIRLQSTEFGELVEPLQPGHIGSSTMPQKRNPHLSEGIVAKARIAQSLSAGLLRNGAHQHERDMGAWAVEWLTVPELMVGSGAMAADLNHLLEGLQVNAECMRRNVGITGGQVNAESLMMILDSSIGRDHAHHLLVELTRSADLQNLNFSEVATADERVASHLSQDQIMKALDPAQYLGFAPEVADRVSRALTAEAEDRPSISS